MLHWPILQEFLLGPHNAPSERVEHPRRARGRTCIKRVWELCENLIPLRTAGRYELLASLNEMADRSRVSPLQQAAVSPAAVPELWQEAACWSGTKARGVLKHRGLGAPLQGRERRTDHSAVLFSLREVHQETQIRGATTRLKRVATLRAKPCSMDDTRQRSTGQIGPSAHVQRARVRMIEGGEGAFVQRLLTDPCPDRWLIGHRRSISAVYSLGIAVHVGQSPSHRNR